MKIAWFTPLDARSAIGRVGVDTCLHLSAIHKVDLWAYEREHLIETNLPIVHYDPQRLNIEKLKQYDVVLYNLGNYATFHGAVFEAMKQFPGIAILHDQTMERFFYQYYTEIRPPVDGTSGIEAYARCMERNYGLQGYENALNVDRIPYDLLPEHICAFPLMGEILPYAKGIFTHAEFFARALKKEYTGPVSWSYLPLSIGAPEADPDVYESFGLDPNKFTLLSNGVVHWVKRIDWITDVLCERPELAKQIQYVVIGSCGGPYGDELRALAEGRLKGCLYLLDYQPYEVMNAFLRRADACVNLRYPNSEVSSLSLFEQMGYENAVVVLDSGIYGEVPEDSVLRVPMKHRKKALAQMLSQMIADPQKVQRTAQRAAQFVREECTLERYTGRLLSFIETLREEEAYGTAYRELTEDANRSLMEIGLDTDWLPEEVNDTLRVLERVLVPAKAAGQSPSSPRTLGLWFGFAYALPNLYREGIMKFILSLTRSLLRVYPDLHFELWSYAVNEPEIQRAFEDLLDIPAYAARMRIVTEANFPKALEIPLLYHHLSWPLSPGRDNLAAAAARFSRAQVFVPIVLYLDNVLDTGKKVFIPAHDLVTCHSYDDFVSRNSAFVFHARDTYEKIGRMARGGATFFSGSHTVQQEQILSYVPGLLPGQSRVVMLPELLPDYDESLLSKDILDHFSLREPYLFYPTQLRPHKNVSTLLDALALLSKEHPGIQLVLTGEPSASEDLQKQIESLHLTEQIVRVQNVSNQELMSLYRYAAAIPVTTLMEGSFPAQASEGLAVGTPVVLSDIPVVRERIAFCGESAEDPGLLLFSPLDARELAEKVAYAIEHREKTLQKQRAFRDAFFRYTWEDAARSYYQLFFGGV